MYQTYPKIYVKCKCDKTRFNLSSMIHQVSSHDGSIEISKDTIEIEDCSGIDIYPSSPVFKTPFIAMKREITKEKLNEINLDDLFLNELPQGKQEDIIATTTANEMSWLSPFHNSCLSPIISKKREHLNEVPESLEPLLSKNDVSWTSSLATPHAHNASWSHINSGDKKTTSADNFDFLLSCDTSQSVTYKKSDITSNTLETSLSRHLEQKHRTAVHSSDETVLYEASFECVDQGHVIDGIVSNHEKFNSCFRSIDRVVTGEQLKHGDKRSLKEGGDKSVIARRLFSTPDNNIRKSKCSINDSRMELSNKNLDTADKDLYVGGQDDVSETACDLQSESQRTLPTNHYNTQEFFDNLSFGTIDELFQATEMLGSAESSPISNIRVESSATVIQENENCNQEEEKSKISKAPNKKLILCRTSTPLNGFSKRNSSCKEMTRKKIKFVTDVENAPLHTSILDFKEVSSKESDSNFFSQELSKILSQELTSKEMLQNTQNLTPCSKINAIKNIASGSKSFVYVQNSDTTKSAVTSNSVFNVADLLKEAQILEDGEMMSLKANLSSSEQKKRLENSGIEYSDSNFVSFSRLCKVDDSKAFETMGPCLKENLMSDHIDVHKLSVVYQNIIDDKILICESSCEKNDKLDQGSPVLISSRSKRLRIESNDTSCEFDIFKESGDTHDHTAKRKCNSTTMIQSKKLSSMTQDKKFPSTFETMNSSECQKFNEVFKEDLVAGNAVCWRDVKQHVPKLEMKNFSIRIESNQSDTGNISLMDVTDTQLIAAGENRDLLSHLTKNGRCSHWQNGYMKQGMHNESENKLEKICEEDKQLLVKEDCISKQLCDVKDNSKESNSEDTIETIQSKMKVESHCLENDLEKSSSNHNSCSENVEILLDSDTVDQLFEESTYFVERNNSKESVKIFPCKDDVTKSTNKNNTSNVILMETNISNNSNGGLSVGNPIMNYKPNDVKQRNICLETAFRKPEPQNYRLASTSEKKQKIPHTETVYMGAVKTVCSISSESEFPGGSTKKADIPKGGEEEVGVCEEAIKKTQSHYSGESMPETADSGLFISSGEKGSASKVIMKNMKPLSSEFSVLESGPVSFGFTTASGKKIKISEEAKQTARLLLSEENTLESREANVGFCLAGGKEVYFSEQATLEPYFSEESILKPKFENCGFSTASRKKLYVSEQTMKQAKSLFAEESTLEVSSENDWVCIASEKNVDVCKQSVKKATGFCSEESVLEPEVTNWGFSTASGKKINVSEEAIKKAKSLFSEDNMSELSFEKSVLEPRVTNCGFSTASGKKVAVSEQAMKKAKLFLSEESVLEPGVTICGFSTASGKKVNVTEEAMKKAKSLFSEDNMSELSFEKSVLEPRVTNCGFSTASGKKVAVSEQAMKKAKLFLSEESVLEPRVTNCGFSTASGKKVNVTEEAMKKAKLLFSEDNMSELRSKNCGFSTASGKKVAVSEQAMKKAKLFLSEESVLEAGVTICGFSTASGKKVNVTEEAMKKAKSLFSEDNMSELSFEKSVLEPRVTNCGFSTASGKKVNVTEEAMKKAKLFLSEESVLEPGVTICGFSTASGKKVNVTEEAMKKAKSLFSDNNMSELSFEKSVLEPRVTNCAFSTASGKKVAVSEQAMKKAKLFLSEESVLEPGVTICGFSTASGKKINVSEEAIKKAKSLFSEDNMSELSFEKSVLEPRVTNCGFSTASGKKVNVTEEAMKKAKLLFSEDNMSELRSKNCGFSTASGKKVAVSEQAMKKAKLFLSEESVLEPGVTICGFSTASGKKVNVTEEAMKKAKSLFSEDNMSELSFEKSVLEPRVTNCAFSTASGKKVNVTEEAMKKTKSLFSEDNMSELSFEKSVLEPRVTNCGFSTASGKKVAVSEQAMKKAKLFLSEESVLEPGVTICGFSTASGKKVNVTEEAMKKAKSLFSEDNMSELSFEKSVLEPRVTNCGFSTASGKKVNVTEEAMKKAKLLFSEDNMSELSSKNCGFSTASGKKVAVSEQAMKKAKSLFPEESMSEVSSENYRFSKTRFKNVDTCEQDMKKVEVFAEEIVLDPRVSCSCSSVACKKKGNVPEVAMEKTTSTFSEDETLNQVVCNFALSIVNTETVDVAKDSLLKNNSKLKLDNYSHAECRTEFNIGEAKNVNSPLPKHCSPMEDIKYGISDHENRIGTHVNNNISSAVVCDAASVYDFLFGTEAMQSHSQSSSSQYKFDVDDNGLKSPVLQRNNLVKTCKPSEIPIDTHSPPSPILKSSNSFIPKKSQNLEIICNNTTANFNVSTNREVARNLFNEKVSDYCKPLCEKSKNVCKITEFVSEISLSQELTEQVADMLLDESSVPLWASSFVTCPDSSGDRFDAPKPVVSSDAGDVLPPVKFDLGCHDRFLTKQLCMSRYKSKLSLTSSKIQSLVSTSLCSNPNEQPSVTKKTSFKVPYKDTGQTGCAVVPSDIQPLRNTCKKLAFGTPFNKRLKVSAVGQETKAQAHSVSSDVDVAAARAEAARQQEAHIKCAKKDGKVRLCKGSHLLKKIQTRETQVTWKDATAGKLPGMYTTDQLLQLGIKEDVIKITAANAAEYRFSSWDFYSPEVCRNNTRGIAVGDGALLVLDAAGFSGAEEFTRAFLSSPGVDPSLLPSDKWVANHYRWIVWKLAATDRSFPSLFTSRCLSPNNVMLQLKYRYDREIDRSERPALSRILQRDDAAAKRLILFVVNILKTEGSFKRDSGPYELELSDGWYSVMAIVDHEMCRLIEAKVVNIGTKIVTYGAELLNCDQGCFPLEAGSEVRLKLHTNSTRRARWYTKLGYHSCPGPIPGSLSSVLPLGGWVSCITVIIARVYPPVYVQKVSDGKSVIRNERMEEKAAAQFERSRQETVESVLSQVLAQLRQESAYKCKQSSSNHRADKMTSQMTGEDLFQLLEQTSDPASLHALLSTEQLEAVMMYQEKHAEKMRRELESRMQDKLQDNTRNVVPLLKIRCTDAINLDSEKYATLSIWRASEDVASLLKEGAVVRLLNISAAGNRYRGAELQLSANKQTVYQPVPRSVLYPQRRVTTLSRAAGKDFSPPFGEVDIVGIVVCIMCAAGCDEVYLASEDGAFLCVVFKGSIEEFGFEDILTPQNKVAACNLLWRPGTSPGHIPRVFAWECSSFCLHPRIRHLQEALKTLGLRMKADMKQFVSSCKEKIDILQQQKACGSRSCDEAAAVAPERSMKTVRSKVPKVVDDVQPPSVAERKIMKLELYGQPPPLSPLVVQCPRGSLRKAFRAPQRVSVPRKRSLETTDSPPLSLESHSEDE